MVNPGVMRLVLPLLAVVLGCSHGPKPAVLTVDSRAQGGPREELAITVPAGWYTESKGSTKLAFLGPDNYSRIEFNVSAVGGRDSCQALASSAVNDYVRQHVKRGAKVDVLSREATAFGVLARLVETTENAPRRMHWYRASCAERALATLACSVGEARETTLGTECRRVLDSLVLPAKAEAPVQAGNVPP